MADPTTNYGWNLPDVGGDAGTWGGILNDVLQNIDTEIAAVESTGGDGSEFGMLIEMGLGAAGAGSDWKLFQAGVFSVLSNHIPESGGIYALPLPNLRPGHRIEAYLTNGFAINTAQCLTRLCYADAAGRHVVVLGHNLSAGFGEATTIIEHDVAAGRFYYLEFEALVEAGNPDGATINVVYAKLTVSVP